MALHNITQTEELQSVLQDPDKMVVLGFFGEFSEASREAHPEFESFSKKHAELESYQIDVQQVKGVHKAFQVDHVPTVLLLKGNNIMQRIVGAQTADYYELALFRQGHAPKRDGDGESSHSVTVYVGPGCVWCTRVKSYLRKRGIIFNEIDVSRDTAAADRMTNRSGQMGVPQLDIDGTMIVGFDQNQIDSLLGLSPENH
jgi:glutaredoxin 3